MAYIACHGVAVTIVDLVVANAYALDAPVLLDGAAFDAFPTLFY